MYQTTYPHPGGASHVTRGNPSSGPTDRNVGRFLNSRQIARLFNGLIKRMQAHRTRRDLRSLDAHLLKDIGWEKDLTLRDLRHRHDGYWRIL
ncbi:MAG: DUF1127 domain-containing protein [Pseudomonadota bacterium]